MIVRVPIKTFYRPERKRGPTGLNFSVGTSEAEFGDEAEASEDPFGFLPSGFAQVGSVAEPVLDAVEAAGYAPEDYADRFDGDGYQSEVVLYAVVEDEPDDGADPSEWVRIEDPDED